MSSTELSAAERRRLDRLARLAQESRKIERELDRSLARAASAGYSLRLLAKATGIPRATIARRLERSPALSLRLLKMGR